MLIAQLSDLHICRPGETVFQGRDSALHLERCIKAVNTLTPRPDFAVLSGDLVQHGSMQEYTRLESILKQISIPYYLMPGNHDRRDELRTTFPNHAYLGGTGAMQYAIDATPLRALMLDTIVPGEEYGALGAERLQWLADALVSAKTPCIIFMHHPPVATGIPTMDGSMLQDADAFWQLISRHPHVVRIACGHLHRPLHTQRHGVPVCVAPSTAAQLSLQLDVAIAAQVSDEAPGFLLHNWVDDQLVTHCVWLPARG